MVDPLTEPFAGLCSALRGMRDQVQALVHVHESIDAFNVAFGDFQNAMALHASCLAFPKAPPAKKVSIQLSGIPPPQTSGLALMRRASRESAESNGSLNGASGGASVTGKNRNSSVGSKGKKSLSMGGRNSGGGGGSSNSTQQQQRAQAKPGQQQKKRKVPPAVKKPESPAWKWDKRTHERLASVLCFHARYIHTQFSMYVLTDIRDQIPRKYQSKDELKKLENILLYIKNRQSGITIADLVKHSGLAVIKSKEILQTLMKLELIHRDHEKSVRTTIVSMTSSFVLKTYTVGSSCFFSNGAGLRVHVRQRTLTPHARPAHGSSSSPLHICVYGFVWLRASALFLCENSGPIFNSCWLVMHEHLFAGERVLSYLSAHFILHLL